MTTSRSSAVLRDEELRLPRPPGVIRRFWARHPLFADILIAFFCLLVSVGTSTIPEPGAPKPSFGAMTVMLLIVLGGCVLMVWRRRWPVLVLAAGILADVTVMLFMRSSGLPILSLAIYALAVYRSMRASWIGLGAGVLIPGSLAFAWFGAGGITLGTAMNILLAIAIPGLIAALIGINVGNRKRYVEAIIDRSRQLLVERDQQAQLAAAAERDRIAREMHDIVSHSLTVVVALSEGAAATDDRDRARDASMAAAATARNALTEMRSMLGVLRDGDADAPLAPLEPTSPAATVQTAQRAGFRASLAVRGEPDAAPALRFAVGRIVQEGVTNAIRHAPTTHGIDVRIDYDASPLIIEIVNDGAPDAAAEGGFGLRGLAERASLLGGVLVSAPAGNGRWMLRAELPHASAGSATQASEVAASPPPLSAPAPAGGRNSAGAKAASRGGDREGGGADILAGRAEEGHT
ncbi:histidine kinase [uncultured Microbacterium sp.]|uniref:sensor histidine kinase n=1 Tax=uncultured Microbacterium sp. TaxID=191216 RepID=UPI0026104F5E|nr:histidine kinase [uncultured Microbacterium sp.]